MDSRSNYEWKPNALVFNFPNSACSTILEQIPDFARIAFGGQVFNRKPCVIPAGTYTYTNEPINWTFPKFPVLPYGYWRTRLLVGRNEERMACTFTEAYTIPMLPRSVG
ncbi:hypothetical protein ONE63_007280 [Megalurothrips usitatus]|uniref:Uncharacterized protein n=1 Tax=Megalurothrips usitatus TaxID=439358 RepID=A0AAV7XVS2_9NEOP|nr:hypothetical protein ONE63_007280 [Megalurothrips usitatus]